MTAELFKAVIVKPYFKTLNRILNVFVSRLLAMCFTLVALIANCLTVYGVWGLKSQCFPNILIFLAMGADKKHLKKTATLLLLFINSIIYFFRFKSCRDYFLFFIIFFHVITYIYEQNSLIDFQSILGLCLKGLSSGYILCFHFKLRPFLRGLSGAYWFKRRATIIGVSSIAYGNISWCTMRCNKW